MNKKAKIIGVAVIGTLVVGTSLFTNAQNLQLQKTTKLIESAEKSLNTTDVSTLKAQQQSLEQQIKSLEKIPKIPFLTKQKLQFDLQKMRSLLPQINANISGSEALQVAEKKAMEAAVLVQNPPHILTTWQQAEIKWYEAATTLQGIDSNTAAGKLAQEKLGTYTNNYQAIGQRVIKAEQAIGFNNQGVAALNSGNLQQAIVYFTKAIETNAALPEAYLGRGIIYAQLGNHQKALLDFDQSIKFNPKLADAYFQRGKTYSNLSNPEQALADYNQIIGLDVNDGMAYLERGIIQSQLGEYQLATADLQKAQQIFSDSNDIANFRLTQQLLGKIPATPNIGTYNRSSSSSFNTSGSGKCNTPDQIARDGKKCGGRAASVKPGGRKRK